jgi:uncharacterized membrane protein (DUF2068 family)
MPAFPFKFKKSGGHDSGLVLIAAYKFLQAMLFVVIGLGAHRMLHKDISDQVLRLAEHFRFNPESRLVNFILDKATLLNMRELRRIGLVAFSYSALSLAEGIGLYLQKAWGEILTLIITASFLPWEIFEVAHRITWIRVGLLVANTLVFIYLLRLVIDRARHRTRTR